MTTYYTEGDRRAVVPGNQLGGEGGEGRVYEATGWRHRGQAVKIYTKRTPDPGKLRAVVARPPRDPTRPRYVSIAWPTQVVLDEKDQPVGLLMPMVPGPTHSMDQLYNPRSRQELWDDFRPTYGHLMLVARAVAGCVDSINAAGHCVGDLNPKNLLLSRTTRYVTIIDCDSMQIVDGGRAYRCLVGVPEYTAPELQGVPSFASVNRTRDTDAFALGVLVFQLLMEGLHPFSVQWRNAGDPPRVGERIAKGMFAYEPGAAYTPARGSLPFEVMDPDLRRLVLRCFVDGHRSPDRRPTPRAWIDTIDVAERRLRTCQANAYHRYGDHLRDCPWCAVQRRTGSDPYPAPFVPREINVPRPPRPAQVATSVPFAKQPAVAGISGAFMRIVATAVDLVVIAVLAALVPPEELAVLPPLPVEVRDLTVGLAVAIVYATLGEWLAGRTVGKWMLGMRVVRFSDSGRLRLRTALTRNLWKYAGLLFCWPLLVGVVGSGDGRTFADRRGKALVVRRLPGWQRGLRSG